MAHNFSLCITSFNRKDELSKTLSEMSSIGILSELDVLICDDGSKDGTYEFVQSNYPEIILFRHNSTKGLISSRNELLDKVTIVHCKEDSPSPILADERYLVSYTDKLQFQVCFCKNCGNYCLYSRTMMEGDNVDKCACVCVYE